MRPGDRPAIGLIGGHVRPDVGGTGTLADLCRYRLKGPFKLAGLGVDRKYGTRRRFGIGPVFPGPTHQQMVADDGWRLQNRERILGVNGVPLIQIQHPLSAKPLHGLPESASSAKSLPSTVPI